jgi:glycosyltransferase involved in cell wall biosynthesis
MRVAILAHGHPQLSPGGGENAAYALYQALNGLDDVEASFWASAPGLGDSAVEQMIDGQQGCEFLLAAGRDPLLFRSALDLTDRSPLKKALSVWRPDVIHAHHFLGIGLDVFWALKRWFPDVPILFTLHEFLSLCPYQGQFLRLDGSLCDAPRLQGCASCMPDVLLRHLRIRDELFRYWVSLIDGFVSPSVQLAEVMGRSGLISTERMHVIDNVLPAYLRQSTVEACGSEADIFCFGFFGNLSPIKGLDLVLKAVLLAREQGMRVRLRVFGGFVGRARAHSKAAARYFTVVDALLEKLQDCVELVGPYQQERIPELMASVAWVVMGSRWRENSPVVIEEALACGRPLLVPNLGGMAEKVRDGLDGYHFQIGSSLALSELMIRCSSDQAAWYRLRCTMRSSCSGDRALLDHLDLYRSVLGAVIHAV